MNGYEDYLASPKWRERRRRWARESGKGVLVCFVCGHDGLCHLHHLTYERLGDEPFEDLIALCAGHHEAVHELLRERRWPAARTFDAIRAIFGWSEEQLSSRVAEFRQYHERLGVESHPETITDLVDGYFDELIAKLGASAEGGRR